jgi:hypothetical protein
MNEYKLFLSLGILTVAISLIVVTQSASGQSTSIFKMTTTMPPYAVNIRANNHMQSMKEELRLTNYKKSMYTYLEPTTALSTTTHLFGF